MHCKFSDVTSVIRGRNLRFLASPTTAALFILFAHAARADVVASPVHSHAASPITTFPAAGSTGADQHQHRTAHDPRAGTFSHVGTGNAYVATKVWVNRTQHALLTGHDPFAHGHQDTSALWAIHRLGNGVNPFPDAVQNDALDRTLEAFNAWVAAGNVGGLNYPGTDTDIPGPGTGVAYHSTLSWTREIEGAAHQVHVTWKNLGAGTLVAQYIPADQTIEVNSTKPWYFGTSTDSTVSPHSFDFTSVILHETGHVVGLGHFGELGTHIMTDEGVQQPLRDGHYEDTHGHSSGTAHTAGDIHPIPAPSAAALAGGMFRSIDLDAEHGVRDLYAIAVPEPANLALVAICGLLGTLRRRFAT